MPMKIDCLLDGCEMAMTGGEPCGPYQCAGCPETMTKQYVAEQVRFRDNFIDGLLELAKAGRLDAVAGEMLHRLVQERESMNNQATMSSLLEELNAELEGVGFPRLPTIIGRKREE